MGVYDKIEEGEGKGRRVELMRFLIGAYVVFLMAWAVLDQYSFSV